jgi:hypothetical protein
MYLRTNRKVFFIFPALAVGEDIDGRYFIEAAWFFFAVGFGDKP